MTIYLLSLLALVSAVINIRAEMAGNRRAVFIFKPLTMVFIITIALVSEPTAGHLYKYALIVGLLCSLIGDIFLINPAQRFIHGLVSFQIAHLCYITAFLISGERRFALLYALPLFIYGLAIIYHLWPYLGRLKIPCLAYMLVILTMAWLALDRWLGAGVPGSQFAALGALVFLCSDSLLAFEQFKGRFPYSQALVLATYFPAQWLMARSI